MNADRGYFLEAQVFGSLNPAVAGEDAPRSVNHHRPQEPKALDTFRELVNLPLAVYPRISRIEFQICN
jgi:hypothetical protein